MVSSKDPFSSGRFVGVDGPVRCEFLGVSSWGGTRAGVVRITHDLKQVWKTNCLLIEDIVDTGLTMEYLLRMLNIRNPAGLKITSLLDKPSNRKVEVDIDYVGFTIPDEFVRLRPRPWAAGNLPHCGVP